MGLPKKNTGHTKKNPGVSKHTCFPEIAQKPVTAWLMLRSAKKKPSAHVLTSYQSPGEFCPAPSVAKLTFHDIPLVVAVVVAVRGAVVDVESLDGGVVVTGGGVLGGEVEERV